MSWDFPKSESRNDDLTRKETTLSQLLLTTREAAPMVVEASEDLTECRNSLLATNLGPFEGQKLDI